MGTRLRKNKKSEVGERSLPNELTVALGENLSRLRKAAGMTQVDLAFEAEVERSRISKLEGGHINPSLLTLGTLCFCLEVTMAELFDGITATVPPVARGGTARRANQAVVEPRNPRSHTP
jgi:transcriptional regulator with XRE-family HTH domain